MALMKLFVKVMLIQDMADTFCLVEHRIVVSDHFLGIRHRRARETCSCAALSPPVLTT